MTLSETGVGGEERRWRGKVAGTVMRGLVRERWGSWEAMRERRVEGGERREVMRVWGGGGGRRGEGVEWRRVRVVREKVMERSGREFRMETYVGEREGRGEREKEGEKERREVGR